MKTEALKESLKKFGEKLLVISKAHYEKVVLGLLVTTLVVFAVVEFLGVRTVRTQLSVDPAASMMGFGRGKALPINFTNQAELLRAALAKDSMPFDLSKGHYVFNPGLWKQYSNVVIQVKSGKEFGIGALVITNITPIKLTLIAKVTGMEDRPNYSIQGFDELPFPLGQRIQRSLVITSVPVKLVEQFGIPQNTVSIILHGVKGDFETQRVAFDMELRFGGETNRVRLLQNQTNSYDRGHTASMVYVPANNSELNVSFPKKRVGTQIYLDGEAYTIIEMTKNQVVFSHGPTGKRIEIPLFGFRGRP